MTLPKRLRNTKWTMRKQLLCYMLVLALLLLFALFSWILMLGRFDSAEKDIEKSLNVQMEVFEKDMSDYFESLAASSIDLSKDMADYFDQDSQIAGTNFDSLTDNPQKIEEVQTALLGQLVHKLQYHNCSGIFVMLDATVNSQVENSAFSRTGLYLHHNRYQNDDNIILFRGISAVGKAQGIMPHRKWRLEFRTDMFPNYEDVAANAKLPRSESYLLSDCFTLAGTSDDVVLMAVPIVGSDGTFYGICGYEISADYFMTYHAQPASMERLACMLLSAKDGSTYTSAGLSCSGHNNHVQPPMGSITVESKRSTLSIISDGKQSFVGRCKAVSLTPNNEPFTMAVMVPKADYTGAVVKSTAQLVILIILLLFFAVSCCVFFSRRYLSPILKGLEQIKQKTWESEHSTIPEINDLFAYLAKQDEEHNFAISSVQNELAEATRTYQDAQRKYSEAQSKLEQAQLDLHRLSYSRKTEVDPEKYELFLEGLKTLTATEKMILDHHLEGRSVKQIMEIAGIKETTIRFHNRNIYSKLNVNSLKQLLLYAAMMRQTEENADISKA